MKLFPTLIALSVAIIPVSLTSCNNAEKNQQQEEENVEKVNEADLAQAEAEANTHVITIINDQLPEFDGTPYLLDFTATWCGPCQQFHDTYEKAAEEYAGEVKFYRVDVDENPGLAEAYSVQSIPMVVGINAKGDATQNIGLMSLAQLDEFIKAAALGE